MLKSLTYISVSSTPTTKDILENILKSSLKNNAALEVTGMLVYHDSTFIQVLEGPAENVDKIYDVIKQDSRHDNLVVLNESKISEREFGKWEMGFRYIDEDDKNSGFSTFKELQELLKDPGESNAKTILKIFYDLNIVEDDKYAKLDRAS